MFSISKTLAYLRPATVQLDPPKYIEPVHHDLYKPVIKMFHLRDTQNLVVSIIINMYRKPVQ